MRLFGKTHFPLPGGEGEGEGYAAVLQTRTSTAPPPLKSPPAGRGSASSRAHFFQTTCYTLSNAHGSLTYPPLLSLSRNRQSSYAGKGRSRERVRHPVPGHRWHSPPAHPDEERGGGEGARDDAEIL